MLDFLNRIPSRKWAVLYYFFTAGLFSIFILLVFKDNTSKLVLLILFDIGFLGPFLNMFFAKQLDKKYCLKDEVGWTYQYGALNMLSLSSFSVAFLLILLVINFNPLKAIILFIISILPFLGMGLRIKTFNNSSMFVNDEVVLGYSPAFYWMAVIYVCYLGYLSAYYQNSLQVTILMFIVTSFAYLALIFPDKFNKRLSWDNRTMMGCIIYIAIIIIVFSIFLVAFMPIGLVQLFYP